MKAKEYLKQIKVYQVMLEQMTEEITTIKINTSGISSNGADPDKVSSSRLVEDKMAQYVVKYVDMENELHQKRWEYAKLRQKIIDEIHQLSDSRYIQILYMHYVQCKRLEEIACVMTKSNGEPYSYDHINTLHGEALIEFDKKVLSNL